MPPAHSAGRSSALLSRLGPATNTIASMQASGTATIIYDAECVFCRRWAERFKKWNRDGVRLLPLQNPQAVELTGKPKDVLLQAMHLVRADGAVFAGASAVREALAHVSWGWLARGALRIPGSMFVADRVYCWVAVHRQRIGCGGDHCTVSIARRRDKD